MLDDSFSFVVYSLVYIKCIFDSAFDQHPWTNEHRISMTTIDAQLVALTMEARDALHGLKYVEISSFPFLVGRDQRVRESGGKQFVVERRKNEGAPANHCYLIESHEPMYISREHFTLHHLGDNRYTLMDRNSACGTIVEGAVVGGGDTGGAIDLKPGQTIQVGTSTSPYLFRFEVNA